MSVRVGWNPEEVVCASCCTSAGVRSGAPASPCGECIAYTLTGTVQVSSCQCELVAMPNPVCAGEPTAFSIASSSSLSSVLLLPGDGTLPFVVSPTGWTYGYASAGIYMAATIEITVGGDAVHCETDVTVRRRPRVRVLGPTQMCWSEVGPGFCAATLSVGPSLPGLLYCVEEVVYGDSVSWQVSCGGPKRRSVHGKWRYAHHDGLG